jgi:hypothetical protein
MSMEEVKRLFERSVPDGDDIPSLMNGQTWVSTAGAMWLCVVLIFSWQTIMSGKSEKDVHEAFQWLVNRMEQRRAPEMVKFKGTSSEKI